MYGFMSGFYRKEYLDNLWFTKAGALTISPRAMKALHKISRIHLTVLSYSTPHYPAVRVGHRTHTLGPHIYLNV